MYEFVRHPTVKFEEENLSSSLFGESPSQRHRQSRTREGHIIYS